MSTTQPSIQHYQLSSCIAHHSSRKTPTRAIPLDPEAPVVSIHVQTCTHALRLGYYQCALQLNQQAQTSFSMQSQWPSGTRIHHQMFTLVAVTTSKEGPSLI
ncbi:hypothetical protein NW759_000732 [Fusarium solani]|nr:hypothetical protein NW759_000732 [Fusarium solani]